jgi:hypothetical protein
MGRGAIVGIHEQIVAAVAPSSREGAPGGPRHPVELEIATRRGPAVVVDEMRRTPASTHAWTGGLCEQQAGRAQFSAFRSGGSNGFRGAAPISGYAEIGV